MAEEKSRVEAVREAAIAQALGRIVTVLTAQGVDEFRALEFVDNNVRFLVAPGLKVHAQLEGTDGSIQVRARGSSDEALTYFAREVHLYHSELGGKAVPFGTEQPPPFEGAEADRKRLAAAQAEAAAASRRSFERDQAFSQSETAARTRSAHESAIGSTINPRAAL